MGGPETPAVGWAGGIERLAELTDYTQSLTRRVTLLPEDDDLQAAAFEIASVLRKKNIAVDILYSGNPRKKLEKAKKRSATTAIFVGRDLQRPESFATLNVKTYRRFEQDTTNRIWLSLAHYFRIQREPPDLTDGNGFRHDMVLWKSGLEK
jgi:histidyl-tRNA synthetase